MQFHLFQCRGLPKKLPTCPLIGYDGRVYSCFERNLFAFESNGSIFWTVPIHCTCNVGLAPVHGEREKVRALA